MTTAPNCLLLLDGRALLGHISVRQQQGNMDLDRLVEAAMAGVLRNLRAHEPTHCLAVIPEPAGDLVSAFGAPLLARLADACNSHSIRTHQCLGHSAAEVLSYFATKALSRGFRSIIAGNDHSLAWAASRGVEVCDPLTLEVHDDSWCMACYGVPTRQLADYMCLVAAAGVGPRLAQGLLRRHDHLDAIVEMPASLSPRERQILVQGLPSIKAQRSGLALNLDLGLKLTPKDLLLTPDLQREIARFPAAKIVRTAQRAKSPV